MSKSRKEQPAVQPEVKALLDAARRRAAAAAGRPRSKERRRFLQTASVGAIAGLHPMAGGGQSMPLADVRLPRGRRRPPITLFFNLSHFGDIETDHHLYLAGRKYTLARVQDAPGVLAAHRRSNAFLRAVPDHKITHQATGVLAPLFTVALGYATCNENPDLGTWEMTGMCVHIPGDMHARAYAEARMLTPTGPLPLSPKRRMYGAPAATSLRDLQEETLLIDPTSFAEALVAVHPDIASMEPSTAAHLRTNYVSGNSDVMFLGLFVLPNKGPAAPPGVTNITGTDPWGTLTPLLDERQSPPQPYKKSDGKLNQYYPECAPDVEEHFVSAIGAIHPLVRDDASLGLDVTPFNLNDDARQPPAEQMTGKLWARHDGKPTVDVTLDRSNARAGVATTASSAQLVFTHQSAETGLDVDNPSFAVLSDGRAQVTLDNVSNWFLRWLGVWVQFFDGNENAILASALPNDTYPLSPGPYPRAGDQSSAIFLGVQSPAFTLLGIPIQPGAFSAKVNMPLNAQRMRVMYTGLGLSGSALQDEGDIYEAGIWMTVAFNYAMVGLFMACGVSTYDKVFKRIVSLGGGAIAQAISATTSGVIDQKSFVAGLASFTMGFLKVLFQAGTSTGVLVPVIEAILEELAEAEWIDAIPVAGQVARAVAAVSGGVQLAETSIEIMISPPAYVFDCVFTHDLSVTFVPDDSSHEFPPADPGYTLYYKVSYMFDNGTAHRLDAVDLAPGATSIPITFQAIPRGGQVNISIGLYARKTSTPPGQNDWCAGYATTGLVPNTVEQVAPPPGRNGFPITRTKVPITNATRYVHSRRTTLDANGNHAWALDKDGTQAPPYIPPPGGNAPGLADFRSITVRQGTREQEGYVGYAWQAFSTGVRGCRANAPGIFDQMANLNTDAVEAQNGYTNSEHLCGYDAGVQVGYHLLTHDSLNLYVDPNSGLVRQVTLAPPAFDAPGTQRSFGKVSSGSASCLVHPAGHLVSIDPALHKLEVLRLPKSPQPDDVTTKFFVARRCTGTGTLPGRILSPVALAIAPDGAILVLEKADPGNNRIQAFDLGGNPVPHFRNQPVPYYLELEATASYNYLDLAVEFSGYLYVLSMSSDGSATHRLDIYHPSQTGTTPISTTMGVNAAKIAVDFWRSVYALNYEVMRLPNGNIPSFTEPSVSVWLPPPS